MKRPRFSLRTLMIAVALAALMAGGYALGSRSAEFAAKASQHFYRRAEHWTNLWELHRSRRAILEEIRRFGGKLRNPNVSEAERVMLKRCERYEAHMYRKYRHAMFFPWLPVAPDPVAPPDPPPPWRGARGFL